MPKINDEKDIEYLDEKFPKEVYYRGVKKPESQLRGEAMVLLALAREQGKTQMANEIIKILMNTESTAFAIHEISKLLDSQQDSSKPKVHEGCKPADTTHSKLSEEK